jgi:hypothetical protein
MREEAITRRQRRNTPEEKFLRVGANTPKNRRYK